jgi:protein-tyrosine-phosphatase
MNILFVCYGNICRSPMAEGLAKLIMGSKERIESAGLVPVFEGAAPEAIKVLQDTYHTDISQHKTRNLADVQINAFDHIIILDLYVFETLKNLFPHLSNKLILWDIQDPFGKDIENYRKAAKKIHDLIQKHHIPLSDV